MKKILILLTLISSYSYGQQLTYNSQYMMNQYLINPAAAGVKKYLPISTSFRQQWAGFKDAPKTQMIAVDSKIGENMGVGGILFNDVTGPLRNIGFHGSYSYHLKINDNSKLAMGLSVSLTQHILDASEFILNDNNDQTLNIGKQQSFNPDGSFGVYYYGERYFAGISIPQLIENKLKFGDNIEEENKQVRHYYFSGGYKFPIGDNFELEPSLLMKYLPSSPFQIDLNSRLFYKKNLWTGFSYRHNESVVALLGIQRDEFCIGYSYDYTLSTMRNYSVGTHELYLEYQLPIKKKVQVSFD
ncbi:type IX secretion system membrane protein PorP/SprF [Flavobacteriales bacterium]|nr:type IX secretion system membrane protein PorP/SprF [Flavobacteriales bacterium]